jgi:hypothetical protein
LFLGVMADAGLVNFGNQFALFHYFSPKAIFTAS